MRLRILLALMQLSLLCTGLFAGNGRTRFTTVSYRQAQQEAAALAQTDTTAAMYIWADKYVYQSGESLTLRWTLKPNNDLYPYTLVAYRINNQTGEKTYLPNGTSEASDIFGNTLEQGFDIVRLPEASKQVLLGDGGLLGPAMAIPDELGMHTLVVQIRDYTGRHVIKSSYFKIGVVSEFVDISGPIESDRTLVNTKAYRLSGYVFVRNSTLTIEPGTFIIGQPGSQPASALVITRTAHIMAAGTRSRPIVMTSSLPFGDRTAGDWGGLILIGQAITNWPGGTGYLEGLPPTDDSLYGGTDDSWSCGTLRYVRVEFAGAPFAPNNEINSFTFGGCGTGTVADHLEATYGFDDHFEWFGGSMNAKYLVGRYGHDDFVDFQIGYRGHIQNVLAVVNPNNSNRGIEGDNNETDFTLEPYSSPRMYNITFFGAANLFDQGYDEGTSLAAIWLRRGAKGSYNNMVLENWTGTGIELKDPETLTNATNGDLTANGLLMWDNGLKNGKTNDLAGQCGAGALPYCNGTQGRWKNIVVADPQLRRPFEYSDPDFRPMPSSPAFSARWIQPPDDGFFDQSANYAGAFADTDWTEEWTNPLQEEDIRPAQ